MQFYSRHLHTTLFRTVILSGFLLVIFYLPSSNSKSQYVQPLNMGMQVAIPYDIANIFNRPVLLGPLASLILSGCLLWILFSGVITSPFGYFFGIPSEKYVLGQTWQSLNGMENSDKDASKGRSLGNNDTTISYPNFLDSMFYMMGDLKNEDCQKLVLCHAHRIFPKLPKPCVKIYQFFSKKLTGIDEAYKDSIRVGLKGRDLCDEIYDSCPESIFGILIRSAVKLMPKWTRQKALKRHRTF